MIVEDGTVVAGANSFVTEDEFSTYCDDRGITPAAGDIEPALVRACTTLVSMIRGRLSGDKIGGRDQSLPFPRSGMTDADGEEIADDEIPQEIKDAQCELAIRELTEAGSTLPDLERGGNIKELQAGSVRVVYGANATAQTTFQAVEGILAGLFGAPSSGFTARAVRG